MVEASVMCVWSRGAQEEDKPDGSRAGVGDTGKEGGNMRDRPPSFYPRSAQSGLCERKMGRNNFQRI